MVQERPPYVYCVHSPVSIRNQRRFKMYVNGTSKLFHPTPISELSSATTRSMQSMLYLWADGKDGPSHGRTITPVSRSTSSLQML